MANAHTPTVLVVDDDPLIAWSVRSAVPGWTVLEANDGAAGITLVRAHAATLDLVVLDVQMPHDGILVCAQLRTEFPELQILPLTGTTDAVSALVGLGCLPPLIKPVPPDLLASALHQAIDLPPPAPTANPLLPYLHRKASESEQALIAHERASPRAALLATSEMRRAGLRGMVMAAGGTVRLEATSPAVLQRGLAQMRVTLLVADSGSHTAAVDIARTFALPLLIVALTRSAALACTDDAMGVVLDSSGAETMAAALTALLNGQTYWDTAVDTPLMQAGLSVSERAVARLLVQGGDTERIAQHLNLSDQSVRRYRAQIFAVLGVTDVHALQQWFDD